MAKKKKTTKLDIVDIGEFDNQIYAHSRNYAMAQVRNSEIKKWSLIQNKIFAEILSQIEWKSGYNSNVIEINNDEFMKEVGWDLANKDIRKMGRELRKELDFMLKNCAITVQDPYSKKYYEGHVILDFEGNSQFTTITINPKIMPHFEKLYSMNAATKVSFLPFYKPDVFNFSCKFAYPLLVEFKSCCKVGGYINHHTMTTKQLKELFNLDIGAYMRDYDPITDKYSKFDRANFEKYVLNPAIEEINRTCMVKILKNADGSYYEKTKTRGKVTGYIFQYIVYDLEGMKKQKQKELENKTNGENTEDIEKEFIHISDEDFLAFEKMIEENFANNKNSELESVN